MVSEKKLQELREESREDVFGNEVNLVPTPNLSRGIPLGTMLPKNMADEVIQKLSSLINEVVDLKEFIRQELNYSSVLAVANCFSSEQIEALALAIKCYQDGRGFIIGDMAGIGKGRVCAGTLRYAYQKGLTPIFITQKTFLFSDIYRDFLNIGQFGNDDKGKLIPLNPLIFNAKDEDSTIKKKNEYEEIEIAYEPPTKTVLENILKKKKLPKDYNCIFLTYSQIYLTKTAYKTDFLCRIAPESILVLDESHSAASETGSKVLEKITPIISGSKAVLFASATYAKTPKVFSLYMLKTALSNIDTVGTFEECLKVGGDNISEYIATGLVKEGQMIRRERSFGDCVKNTYYVGTFGEGSNVVDDLDDNQQETYDNAIIFYRNLKDFSNSERAINARDAAFRKYCTTNNIPMISQAGQDMYIDEKKGRNPTDSDYRKRKISEEPNTYVIHSKGVNSVNNYRALFLSNLFLCLKARFCADKVIECLRPDGIDGTKTIPTYTNLDGIEHTTPLKPVIAIRLTGESMLSQLNLKHGEECDNDFKKYIEFVYAKANTYTFNIRQVNSALFTSRYTEEKITFKVDDNDYDDLGAEFYTIKSSLDGYVSDLPMSAIDYMRERIEQMPRPSYYNYGSLSPNFIFSEATGRDNMLKINKETNRWEYHKIDKESVTQKFLYFNNGRTDVLLLNTSAAAGASAQSSPREGSDTRPRNMFIIQFEGDVNVEVQKRGRINRTGQLNSPTYSYIISKIPAELRTYLMFRKKLRKLDANVSANQSASTLSAEITGQKGEVVEDIFNKYGVDVFNKLKEQNAQGEFGDVFNDILSKKGRSWNAKDNVYEDDPSLEAFKAFALEMELHPCARQEIFYNAIIPAYASYIKELKAKDEYEAELQIKNYRASLHKQSIVALYAGGSVFASPLFMSDYFSLDSEVMYSKDKLEKKINQLAEGYASPMDRHNAIIKEYRDSYEGYIQQNIAELNKKKPKRTTRYFGLIDGVLVDQNIVKPDETWQKEQATFDDKIIQLRSYYELKQAEVEAMLLYFEPYKSIAIDEPWFKTRGVFMGINLSKPYLNEYKFLSSHINFVFALLSSHPKYETRQMDTLRGIRDATEKLTSTETEAIKAWKPLTQQWIKRRFYTGNILKGIIAAINLRGLTTEKKGWRLNRFTNVDASITTGVELTYERDYLMPDLESVNTLEVAANHPDIGDLINNDVKGIWNVEDKMNKKMSSFIKVFRFNKNFKTYKGEFSFDAIDFKGATQIYGFCTTQVVMKKDKAIRIYTPVKKDKKAVYNPIFDSALVSDFFLNLTERDYSITERDYSITVPTFKTSRRKAVTKAKLFYTLEELQAFLVTLHSQYATSYAFKDIKPYVNPKGNEALLAIAEYFPVAEYPYRFFSYQDNKDNFPDLLEVTPNTTDNPYGGVILARPITPIRQVSLGLMPDKMSNEVMVKMFFYSMADTDKEKVKKALTILINDDASDYEVGEYIDSFLAKNGVNTKHYFGFLQIDDYGKLMIEFHKENDISKLVFKDEPFVEKQTEVTYELASDFLLDLLR